jgi:poly(A) polymerase
MEAAMPQTPQLEAALQIIAALRAAGYESYLAGGCVRDLLLGREPHDYDVATSATPDVVLDLFPRTFAVGAHFGVVLVATRGGAATCGGADGACAPKEDLQPGDEYQSGNFVRARSEQLAPPQVVTEVATFRSDGAYSDGRHPDAVRYTRSAEEDVRRRDFTINGLLLDTERLFPQGLKPAFFAALSARLKSCPDTKQLPEQSVSKDKIPENLPSGAEAHHSLSASCGTTKVVPFQNTSFSAGCDAELPPDTEENQNHLRSAVIDHVGGVADLEAGVVRAIGQPTERFEEDHLRMLRAVRFAARFGFQIDLATAAAIRRLAAKIKAVSRERVRDELTKMLTEGRARRAFELLDETGLLAEVLPEVAKMKGVEQPPQFHPEGDVWTHTLLLLEQLEAGCPLPLAWAALLHDVGKPATFRRAERIRFDGHVDVGVAMGAEICRRFRFSNDESSQMLSLIENHMRFADAQRMKAATLKRFFRLQDFPQHLALHRMDCLAGSGNLDHWNFVRERYESMPEEAVRPAPLVTGRELIAAGYRPGAAFREMLSAVEDAQLEGAIATPAEAMALLQSRFPLPK